VGDDDEHGQCRVGQGPGADLVIDYRKEDYAATLRDYDLAYVDTGRAKGKVIIRVN
jgi:hypothetical protein